MSTQSIYDALDELLAAGESEGWQSTAQLVGAARSEMKAIAHAAYVLVNVPTLEEHRDALALMRKIVEEAATRR